MANPFDMGAEMPFGPTIQGPDYLSEAPVPLAPAAPASTAEATALDAGVTPPRPPPPPPRWSLPEQAPAPGVTGTPPNAVPSRPSGGGDVGRMAYRYLVDRGLTPDQAAAWAGNFAWESGGRPDNVNENDNPRGAPDAPHSAGIAQWNGSRLRALLDFARQRGIDVPQGDLRDPRYTRQAIARVPLQVQLDYAWQEAQGGESRAFRGIQSGRDVDSAGLGAISYFRPAGWTWGNPAGGHGYANRQALARRILAEENRQVMQDRSADAGMAPDPALMAVPAPMGGQRAPAPFFPGATVSAAPAGPAAPPPSMLAPQGRPDAFAGLGPPQQDATPFGQGMDFFAQMGLAAPSRGRLAGESGSVGGYLDTLRGIPAGQDIVTMLNATRDTETRQALTSIATRAGEIVSRHPGLPPQQLYSMMLADPAIGMQLMSNPSQGLKILQDAAKNAGVEPQWQTTRPGEVGGFVTPPATPGGQAAFRPVIAQPPADVQETEYEMQLYRSNPEEYARYMAAKRARTGSANVRPSAEIVTGGSERARALGITHGRAGERFEVKIERDPITGLDRVVDINFPDRPAIDLGQLAQQETVKALVKNRSEIQARQAAVINAARISERIIQQLDAGGETSQGILGAVTQIGEGLTSQAAEAARIAGVPLDPIRYREALRPFINAGANTAATQSNITALAFMLARAQNASGMVTENDMNRALQQIGAGLTGSTAQMRASLEEMMRNAINGVDDRIVVGRSEYDGTGVEPPRQTRDLLTELRLTRYTGAPPAAPHVRPFAEGEIERMSMQELISIPPATFTPHDLGRAVRRRQQLQRVNPAIRGPR